MGEMVRFARDGKTFQGYQAGESGPGIILIQEWWGLVGHIKSVADRLANEGFVVLAPDFYEGRQTDEPDEAASLMMTLDIEKAAEMVRAAIDHLLADERVGGEKVGAVGFCMGGQLALYAATLDPRIGAVVDFYGIHPNVKPELDRLQAPLLGIFASQDEYATPEAVKALDEELTRLGKPHEFHTYDAQHAFFNDDRPSVYNPGAAADAWQRMLMFFRKHLEA